MTSTKKAVLGMDERKKAKDGSLAEAAEPSLLLVWIYDPWSVEPNGKAPLNCWC
jgi:hypothetical protein